MLFVGCAGSSSFSDKNTTISKQFFEAAYVYLNGKIDQDKAYEIINTEIKILIIPVIRKPSLLLRAEILAHESRNITADNDQDPDKDKVVEYRNIIAELVGLSTK